MADILENRVDFAKKFTATHSYLMPEHKDGESYMEYAKLAAMELSQKSGVQGGFDIVFEASGAEDAIRTALFACRKGGTLLQVGLGYPESTVSFLWIARNELDVKGVIR